MVFPGEPEYCEVCGQRIPEEGGHECPPNRIQDYGVRKQRTYRILESELEEYTNA